MSSLMLAGVSAGASYVALGLHAVSQTLGVNYVFMPVAIIAAGKRQLDHRIFNDLQIQQLTDRNSILFFF